MSTKIEQLSWGGWPHCYRLSNPEIELILTADVGPRVIRCGFVGGPNVFKEYAEIWLVNTKLLLHGFCRQPCLAPDNPTALAFPEARVDRLHSIGTIDIGRIEPLPHWQYCTAGISLAQSDSGFLVFNGHGHIP